MRAGLLALLLLIASKYAFGQGYFQQEVNYAIYVELDDRKHTLDGNIRIAYINHSPDVLNEVFMHHWPNAYSSVETPMARQLVKHGKFLFQFSGPENTGSIRNLQYKVNGVDARTDDTDTPADFTKLILPTSLDPGDTAIIETPFFVQLPDAEISRLGHSQQAYYITQWYPKPAVYDSRGWHAMSYLTMGEFYSNFGHFEVNITLPSNYVVMATGELQNEDELEWLSEKARSTESWQTTYKNMSFPPSAPNTKTLTYKQGNIHDFAWFADKRYRVAKGEVVLPHSGRTVTAWAAFTDNEAKLWQGSIDYLTRAVYDYSLWNGDYPYNHVTAVDGVISAGAGMEYPMITIIGESGNEVDLETVIMHEVGHNWFYGALASNERRFPWMDEGMNTANEMRYMEKHHPNLNIFGSRYSSWLVRWLRLDRYSLRDQNYFLYAFNARRNLDQAPCLQSEDFTPLNYGAMVYAKAALAFEYLRAYAGNEAYDTAMKAYFDRWKFKHPYPEDVWPFVQQASGDDAQWVKDQICTTKKSDFKIKKLKRTDSGYDLTIKAKGIEGPVACAALNDKGEILQEAWIHPFGRDTTVQISARNFHRLVLDHDRRTTDINRKNNSIRSNGVFRKMEPLRFQWLAGMEDPSRTTLYYTPALGYNTTDGAMAGLLLHNVSPLQKMFEFRALPMYGFGSNEFRGMATLQHNLRIQTSRWIENLRTELSAATFGTGGVGLGGSFTRYELASQLDIRRNPLSRNLSHHIHYAVTHVSETFGFRPLDDIFITTTSENLYGLLAYELRNRLPIRPYQLMVTFDLHEDFDRVWLEWNGKFVMNKHKRSLFLRFFGGTFLHHATNNPRYNFRMDGINGAQDFRYSQVFPGRFENSGFLSQQFVAGHGNFKIPTANGQTNSWLVAANAKIQSPFKFLPLGIYADVGFSDPQGLPNAPGILANAGIYLWLVPEIVEVYFPFVWTEDIQREIEARGLNYSQLIRFMINFNEINPFKAIRRIPG